MSSAERPRDASRPTLLVGYGAFGLDVLRRLLASAAQRGVLRWEEPRGGGSPGERHLQDLGLLWMRDRMGLAGQQVNDDDVREGTSLGPLGSLDSLEMLRDLYQQIQPVGEKATPETDLTAAVEAAAATLLSAAGRAGRPALPLGLDVVVLARPTGPEVLGLLDALLTSAMERLADNPNLERAVQGAEPVTFSAILDFENYGDRSEAAHRVRAALVASVERWQRRRAARLPGFGRIYLVDGRNDDGFRDGAHRLDEITLFLEFLLFEGQRAGALQSLYQSAGAHESPVATFGIRLLERSSGLLARLAAARFGVAWLDYLAGNRRFPAAAEPGELRQCLAPYGIAGLDGLVDGPALRGLLDRQLAALEGDLFALSPDLPDWPRRIAEHGESFLRQAMATLQRAARERMATIGREGLDRLPEAIEAAITGDLHHPSQPATLGAVLAAMDGRRAELDREDEPPPAAAAAASPETWHGAARIHAAYRRFAAQRLSTPGLRLWWTLLALVLAAGLTPVATDLLGDLPQPGLQTAFWVSQATSLLRHLNHPVVLEPLLFLATWALGRFVFQRAIAGRLNREQRFFTDADRGRFIASLRAGLQPGGALRARTDRFLAALLRDMTLAVRSEVGRELATAGGKLRERLGEMVWLREQLRGFLGLHGLTAGGARDVTGLIRDSSGIRCSAESADDLERMLSSHPPIPERFVSIQAQRAPFAGWARQYSDTFLHPLAFIDDLSRIFKDPFLAELGRAGAGPEQEAMAQTLLDFLATYGSFDLAFHFKAQEGLPAARRYCLLPAVWRQLPRVKPALADLGMPEAQVLEGAGAARAYLLRLQIGVGPRCLLEAE